VFLAAPLAWVRRSLVNHVIAKLSVVIFFRPTSTTFLLRQSVTTIRLVKPLLLDKLVTKSIETSF
jgi:hypothetical protein